MKYFLLLLHICIKPALLSGQSQTAISGCVYGGDSQNYMEELSGAPVIISRLNEASVIAVTDAFGYYYIPLDPGKYTIDIKYPGCISIRIINVPVKIGQHLLFDAFLDDEFEANYEFIMSMKNFEQINSRTSEKPMHRWLARLRNRTKQ